MKRILVRTAAGTVAFVVPVSAYMGYKHRPRASFDIDFHESLRSNQPGPSNAVEAFFHRMAQTVVLGFVSNILGGVINTFNNVEMLHKERLYDLITQDRPDSVPLLTVSNHISTMDDPGLVSAIMPQSARWNARRMRWGICTEEICFKHPFLGSFFGLGKALPITRGGSIHQKGIATLQQKLNAGDWVHVFPEGRVWQEGGTPLRDEQGRWCSASGRCGDPLRKVGPMKWGVGKLVANSEKAPIILPMFHLGTSELIPQDERNQVIRVDVFGGHDITVAFGKPIDVSDLLAAYHDGARQRAVQRNKERERKLAVAMKRREKAKKCRSDGKGGSTGGGWWSWLGSWFWSSSAPAAGAQAAPGSESSARVAGLALTTAPKPATAVPPPALTDAVHVHRPGEVPDPVNTDEMVSDHTGASAHVAGLTRRMDETPGSTAADAATTAAASSQLPPLGPSAPEPSQLTGGLLRKTEEVVEAAIDTARSKLQQAKDESAELAADVRAKAEDLVSKLRALADEGEEVAKEAVRELRDFTEEIERRLPLSPSHPFRTSVSTPEPPRRRWPAEQEVAEGRAAAAEQLAPPATAVTVAAGTSETPSAPSAAAAPTTAAVAAPQAGATQAAQSAGTPTSSGTAVAGSSYSVHSGSASGNGNSKGSSGPRRAPAAGAGAGAGASSPFPLSDEPVTEIVPTRKLRTGIVVPMYIEAPLRAKPPDHEWLTLAEAEAEEALRLQLYADIAGRISAGLLQLEEEVRTYRAAKGIVEKRPMS